jgi:NAD(P)-dependent dehydrogenase (short-subunit alcohol dehydrogenase family)
LTERNSGPVIVVTGGNRGIGFEIYAAYRISKTALNAVTAILAAELRGTVAVNSVCPGWVKTDMGGPNADRDVAQGADSAMWLALDAPQKLSGNFVRDRKAIPW